jgi:FkbM family methyltransferase
VTPLGRADALVSLLQPERRTAVVDVGANPFNGDLPWAALLAAGLCTVVGFEPHPEALAALRAQAGPLQRFLPDVLGDGGPHTLHLCRASGMSSLLPPDPERLSLFRRLPALAAVVERVPVSTRRLDDVAELGPVDLLKLDVQGSELTILRHARNRLAEVVMVQVEVSFVPLYQGQPLAWEVEAHLRSHGFVPHTLASVDQRPLAPLHVTAGAGQLVEADVVYVRDPGALDALTSPQLQHLAVLAHGVVGAVDLAYRCVDRLARRGAAPRDAAGRYAALLQG